MTKQRLFTPKGLWLPGLDKRRRNSGLHPVGNLRAAMRLVTDRGTIITMCFTAVFTLFGLRLVDYRINSEQPEIIAAQSSKNSDLGSWTRPTIADKNGVVLAVDIPTPRLYADASQVLSPKATALKLSRIFPDIKSTSLIRKFKTRDPYFVIQQVMTPSEQAAVLNIGEPGLKVEQRPLRLYPMGKTASHLIGYMNGNHRGASGLEAFIDDLSEQNPNSASDTTHLTVDVRVQIALENSLASAQEHFKARASGGLVMDIHTGDIVALASAPRYDPNNLNSLAPETFNRIVSGTYELGSVFKLVTLAAAFEHSVVSMDTEYDVLGVLKVGSHTIEDYIPQARALTVREIFTKSSNIGAVLVAQDLGARRWKGFLSRLGLLDPMHVGFNAAAAPQLPERWGPIELATAAYGHGYAVSPLQFTAAAATLLNGGLRVRPNILLNSSIPKSQQRERVVSEETSAMVIELLRQNVLSGSGRRARVPGYKVGGKTGTADKVVDGRYSEDAVFNSFLSVFPTENPQYVLFVFLDEPQALPETRNNRTAGWNVAPTSATIIRKIAPMLGIAPTAAEGRSFAIDTMMMAAKREVNERRIEAALPLTRPVQYTHIPSR